MPQSVIRSVPKPSDLAQVHRDNSVKPSLRDLVFLPIFGRSHHHRERADAV